MDFSFRRNSSIRGLLRSIVGDNQRGPIGYRRIVAAVEADEVGNSVIVVIEFEAQTQLGNAPAGVQLINVREGGTVQIDGIQRTDRRWVVGTYTGLVGGRLEIGGQRTGASPKEAVANVDQQALEDAEGVTTAANELSPQGDPDTLDHGVIRQSTGIEGQYRPVLSSGGVIAQHEGGRCSAE